MSLHVLFVKLRQHFGCASYNKMQERIMRFIICSPLILCSRLTSDKHKVLPSCVCLDAISDGDINDFVVITISILLLIVTIFVYAQLDLVCFCVFPL